jgi:hypothetical protein
MSRTQVDLVYGRSGMGKSTWILKIAKYLFETKGLKTRWYIGDGGGSTIEYSGLIDDKVIELFQFTNRPHPFETTLFACQGKWPKDVENPTSPWQPLTEADKKVYGLYVFEGLSAMSKYLISGAVEGGIAQRRGTGQKTSQMDGTVVFKDGEVNVSNITMSDFGTVQRTMYERIQETYRLPGMVYWTAHQREADDAETKERLIGPEVLGKAMTTSIGASFGNTIHMDTALLKDANGKPVKKRDPVTKKEVDEIELVRRAYTREHYDPDAANFIKYYANNRCASPDKMPSYLEPPDPIEFYRLLREGRMTVTKA